MSKKELAFTEGYTWNDTKENVVEVKDVQRGVRNGSQWLSGKRDGRQHRHVFLEEHFWATHLEATNQLLLYHQRAIDHAMNRSLRDHWKVVDRLMGEQMNAWNPGGFIGAASGWNAEHEVHYDLGIEVLRIRGPEFSLVVNPYLRSALSFVREHPEDLVVSLETQDGTITFSRNTRNLYRISDTATYEIAVGNTLTVMMPQAVGRMLFDQFIVKEALVARKQLQETQA